MGANDVQILLIGKDVNATGTLKSVGSAAAGTMAQIASLGRATSGLNQIFNSAAGVAAGIAGFNGLTAAIQGTAGAVFDFKKGMEVHETGMAGILLSMTEINGRSLTWGESIALSKDIMTQLNAEALRTAATTEELTGAFRGILGPALNAKMTISEIIQLSSAGVNAVKSIMPNNGDVQRQIVQELRDLVAGGIQPSSSTLATALGLKDKDIQAAKESSEGLFKFLMDRLKGFEISAPAYARTWQGIQDQIKEGFTLAGSQGTDQLFAVMKDEMAAVAAEIVVFNKETGKMEVNPAIVGTFREISNTVISAGHEVKQIADDIGVVAVPAAKVLGGAIKIAAENAQALTYAIGGWLVLRHISVIMADASAAAAGATQAQTFLGKAVLDTQAKYAQQAAVAAEAAAAERAAAMAAAQAQMKSALASTTAETAAVAAALGQKNLSVAIEQTVVAKNEEAAAAARTAEIINAANAAARLGQYEVAQAILTTNLSISEQAAIAATMSERMVLAATVAKAGQLELAQSILATTIAIDEQGIAATVAGERSALAATTAAVEQRALTGSVVATTAAHVESGFAAEAAGATTVTAAGVAKTAVGNLLSTVWALAGGWLGVAAAASYALYQMNKARAEYGKIKSYNPDTEAKYSGGKYFKKTIYDGEDQYDQAGGLVKWKGMEEWNEFSEDEYRSQYQYDEDEKNKKNGTYNYSGLSIEELKKQLSAKYPAGDDGKGAAKAAKAAERAYEEKQRLQDKIADMIAKMDNKITEETGTVFQSSTAKLTAETDNIKRELDKSKIDFAKYGIDVSGVYTKIAQYQDVMTAKIERQRTQELAALRADTAVIAAGINGNPEVLAEAEYQKELVRIKKERESDELFKKTAKGPNDTEARAAADAKYAAMEAAALKTRNDKYREAQLQKYDVAVEHNRLLNTLEHTSTTAIDAMNKRVLESKISYLQTELQSAKLTQQERLKLEKELADAIEQRNQIMSKSMVDAVSIAISDIKNKQFDFADLYKNTWNDIDSSVNEHFRSILRGNEHLGEGIKGTISDIGKSITDMFADIIYQTYIMQPVKNWFIGLLGNIGGGINLSGSRPAGVSGPVGSNGGFYKKFAEGGRASGWSLVGEEGPELVNFTSPARVYDANKTKVMMNNNQKSQPIIRQQFNIYANDYSSFRKNQTQMMAEAQMAASRAARRNC